ncbi:MAG: hypothetical protein JWS10_923 [Cypionkella sp.]|uniref:hypothetical protein n=1 Tax=Cypionkella sp. TaxID=2811411 RepID=UPI00261EA9F4|nr:hypothetical protein [Cypionkella sp.]MDB5658308.1 hypothetical protein [Cypionkella sp.]
MRSYTSPELAYLQARDSWKARGLFWVRPRDRATGLRAGMGFWTGEEDAVFVIGGEERLYRGGGALKSIDPIVMQSGLVVRMQRVSLSPLFDEVNMLLRGMDAWRAPSEIHRAFFDPITNALIATPKRLWKGVIDKAPIQTPAIGGESKVDVILASAAESLTHGLTLTRSDAVQSLRGGDRFYRYKDVSGAVSCSWGEKRAGGPKAPPKPPMKPPRGSDR